jgi:hypothetical protein
MSNYGVKIPNVIDFISHKEGVCNLHIVQADELTDERLFKLQDKLNHYLTYALDGQLEAEFPDLPKLQIRIQLWLEHEPDNDTLKFLDKAAYSCSIEGVELVTEMGIPNFGIEPLTDTV